MTALDNIDIERASLIDAIKDADHYIVRFKGQQERHTRYLRESSLLLREIQAAINKGLSIEQMLEEQKSRWQAHHDTKVSIKKQLNTLRQNRRKMINRLLHLEEQWNNEHPSNKD